MTEWSIESTGTEIPYLIFKTSIQDPDDKTTYAVRYGRIALPWEEDPIHSPTEGVGVIFNDVPTDKLLAIQFDFSASGYGNTASEGGASGIFAAFTASTGDNAKLEDVNLLRAAFVASLATKIDPSTMSGDMYGTAGSLTAQIEELQNRLAYLENYLRATGVVQGDITNPLGA